MIISLTGFMGVGKSTIAGLLAKHLYCKLVDLDKLIEQEQGMAVSEIFSSKGELYFRKLEEETLEKLINKNKEKILILSLGGGTLMSEANRIIISKNTYCIYLKASLELLTERLMTHKGKRPVVENIDDENFREEIRSLFEKRKPGYEAVASIIIDVDRKSIRTLLLEIISIFSGTDFSNPLDNNSL
ncbi:MAG: shikimate kinase [Rikenellaceae bacterium]|nr:shikimate kinase [Rikenellaceae bacterium]